MKKTLIAATLAVAALSPFAAQADASGQTHDFFVAGNLGQSNLRDSFTLSSAGSREGLDWVLVEPRKPEADFRRALFGFSKGDLRKMIIDDRLGQTATIELARVERNARVDPQEVSFTPPKDADVIGTPAK